jgi:hypothetical protein
MRFKKGIVVLIPLAVFLGKLCQAQFVFPEATIRAHSL